MNVCDLAMSFFIYISLNESVETSSKILSLNIIFIELNKVSILADELVRNFTFSRDIVNFTVFSVAITIGIISVSSG